MGAGKYLSKVLKIITGTVLLVILLHDIKLHTQLRSPGRYLRVYYTTEHRTSNQTDRCLATKTKLKFYICPHDISEDIYISKSLSTDGVWEPKMTKMLGDILENEQNSTFIDVGANIGYFSLLAAVNGRNALAIEPITRNIGHFHKAIVMNNIGSKITILQNAVSDVRRDAVMLALGRRNQGAARVLSDNELREKGTLVEPAVSILMDDLIGLVHTPDVIIKMDIEGHECKAIAKSSLLFQLFNVKAVFMEWQKMVQRKYIYGTACQHADIDRMVHQLSSWGLTAYDVQSGNRLDVTNSAQWTSGDIVWRKR